MKFSKLLDFPKRTKTWQQKSSGSNPSLAASGISERRQLKKILTALSVSGSPLKIQIFTSATSEMTEAKFSRQRPFHRKRTQAGVDLGWCLWKLCPREGTALVALTTWAAGLWALLMMGIRSESSRILSWAQVSVSFLGERVKWPQSHQTSVVSCSAFG